MKKVYFPLIHFSLLLIGSLAAADAPRLFITAERLEDIKRAAAQPDSPAAEMVEGMRIRIGQGWNEGYIAGFRPGRRAYQSSWLAREAALMHLVTGQQAYLDAAIREIREGVGTAADDRGLNNAFHSMAFALVYDWGRHAMSDEDRAWFEEKITEGLDHWPRISHVNFGADRGSNWVSVCRGAELVLLLASGQHEARADRLAFLVGELQRHIRSAIGSTGYTQEGVGYMSFGGAFLVPAAVALENVTGDSTLKDMLAERNAWVFPMFTGATGDTGVAGWQKFLPNGVSNVNFMDEGWVSALLGVVPEESMPYYLGFYNRHAGPDNRRPLEARYDSTRGGTTWALLFYPFDVESKDPAEKYGHAAFDQRGYYFFRSKWGSGDEVMTSIMADTNSHQRAWDQPEALQIALHAHDTSFFVGPARRRDPQFYSAPLVNGERGSGNPQHHKGRSFESEKHENGGYVIVGGGEVYRNRLSDIRRHYLVDFSGSAGSNALLSTLDVFENGSQKTYTWNAVLADEMGRDGLEDVSVGREAGRPMFLLRGRNDSYVKGWVLHPSDTEIRHDAGDDVLQFSTQGDNARIWVVMTVGTGSPPEPRISGEGMGSLWSLGHATVRYDADADRVLHETTSENATTE